jgi:predicted aminopeptidase
VTPRSSSRCSAPDAPAAIASASACSAAATSRARAVMLDALVSLSLATSGCYLAHLARGQVQLLCARVPVEDVLREPDTTPELRAKLARVAEVRSYAEQLGLAVGGRYSEYAPWPGDAVVTTVVATRPGEVEPVTTLVPRSSAASPIAATSIPHSPTPRRCAWRKKDLDVCEQRVRAYSTLGWFDDPLTGPMLREDEATLVRRCSTSSCTRPCSCPAIPSSTRASPAFFGQEARVRFYADRDGPEAGERRAHDRLRAAALRAEILALRRAVEALTRGARGAERATRTAPRSRRGARAHRRARARRRSAPRSRGAAARRRLPRDLGHLPRRHGAARGACSTRSAATCTRSSRA